MPETTDLIRQSVLLAPFTTLGLGGAARYFAECRTDQDVVTALEFAREHGLKVHVLGGGSNTIFADEGFRGIVLHIASRGMQFARQGDESVATVAAGESWDAFVNASVEEGLAGVECLAGIPGTVGATPVQNVGAYGQEVSSVIAEVTTLDRTTNRRVTFGPAECGFGYRQSRFKSIDSDRFIITAVRFKLLAGREPRVQYPDLRRHLEESGSDAWRASGKTGVAAVRDAVVAIRRQKSMVIDPADPNTRSVGSFFTNPVLAPEDFARLQDRYHRSGRTDAVPSFSTGNAIKVPAAWLVEHAGFRKGYRWGNVGISGHHALALVNFGGTTEELLGLARQIQTEVRDLFGISLEREPVVVSPT